MKLIPATRFIRMLYSVLPVFRWTRSLLAMLMSRPDFRTAKRELLQDPSLSDSDKNLLDQVSLHVHCKDEMYVPTDAKHYLLVGLSALRCIDEALKRSNRQGKVRTILDFPSGFGRVLRFLKTRFPEAEITAMELDRTAVEFCHGTFSVNALESNTDLKSISLPGKFDLIWCGSLITHLEENGSMDLLKFLHDHLAPGGVCVFTTHGRLSAEWIEQRKAPYGLTKDREKLVLEGYREKGYGYADYWNRPGYGVSVISRSKIQEMAQNVGFQHETVFGEAGWDKHQDVYGYTF